MKDRTKDYDYQRLLEEETRHFDDVEPSAELLVIDQFGHRAWAYYWQRFGERLAASPWANIASQLERRRQPDRPLRILSLASGYCGHELMLAEQLGDGYQITCTDLNVALFDAARKVAEEKSLAIDFARMDMNFPDIEAGRYDLICSYAAIHHAINLEHLLEQIAHALTPDGVFHVVEVVGRNRLLIWEENEDFANRLLAALPTDLIRGEQLYVPAGEGMEGIRQEEILPLLADTFEPLAELHHGAFMRYVCTGERLGRYLDPDRPRSRAWLDFLIDTDESAIRHGLLRPLELWGVYRPRR